ncbi:MAG: ATPase [Oscillospiraceae bacterium]|jgi:V/A-type H+-transporting ATPase subunit K|nr:ATPase [Oscillospiraceae bacterium]
MSTFVMFLLPLAAVALLMAPVIPVYTGVTTGKKARHAIAFNLCAFLGICLLGVILPISGFVSAADTAAAAASTSAGMGYIAAALVTGISAIGAGIAIAAAAPAAIGAVSEDGKNFGKALIFVVLGEGIALYGLLISILILNKI